MGVRLIPNPVNMTLKKLTKKRQRVSTDQSNNVHKNSVQIILLASSGLDASGLAGQPAALAARLVTNGTTMDQSLVCRPSRRTGLVIAALAITALLVLTSACGTKTTGIDERCADLAATGYTEVKQMQELLLLANQATGGSAESVRQRTMALCVKEAS